MENAEMSGVSITHPCAQAGFASRQPHFAFRVNRLDRVAAAHGRQVAESLHRRIGDVLAAVVGGDADVTPVGHDGFAVRPSSYSCPLDDAACIRFAADAVDQVGRAPLPLIDGRFHASLSCLWSREGDDGASGTIQSLFRQLRETGSGPEQAAGDAHLAADLLAAVASDRLVLAWQPVGAPVTAGSPLYYEGLARLVEDDGLKPPGTAIGALERLGLVHILDRLVVRRVVGELMFAPDVRLGANISALSARPEGWWDEITETAAFPDMVQAADFAIRMRRLGVSIAIDDFGVGHMSVRQLLALQPDIVKIDRFFLKRAAHSEREMEAFAHLVGLAQAWAPTVILEGVENADDDARVTRARGVWRQGCHIGAPSVFRNWKRPRNGAAMAMPATAMKAPARFGAKA